MLPWSVCGRIVASGTPCLRQPVFASLGGACRSIVKCSLEKVSADTPVHFSRCGIAQLHRAGKKGKEYMLLHKSTLYVCTVDEHGVPSFPVSSKVSPTMNSNARLHCINGEQYYTIGGTSFFKTKLLTHHLEIPEGDNVLSGGAEWRTTQLAMIGENLQNQVQVTVGDKLVVVGETYYDEINENPPGVYVYNHEEDRWTKLECGGQPPTERTDLTAFQWQGKLHLLAPAWAGHYDMHVLDLESCEWSKVALSLGEGVQSPPLVRTGATVNVLGDRLVMFGGTQLGAFIGDVAVLNLSTNTWEQVQWTGEEPIGRTGHMALPVSDKELLTFGGNTNHIGSDNNIERLRLDY